MSIWNNFFHGLNSYRDLGGTGDEWVYVVEHTTNELCGVRSLLEVTKLGR